MSTQIERSKISKQQHLYFTQAIGITVICLNILESDVVFASVYIPLIDSFSTVQIYDLSYINVY